MSRSPSSSSIVDDARVEPLLRRHPVLGGVDVGAAALAQHLAGQRVDLDDALDLVAEELDAEGQVLVRREDLQHVAAHAELAAHEVHVVALVLDVGQLAQHLVAPARSRPP